MTDKKEILVRAQKVPSLPAVVMKLRKYLNDPDVNFDELAKVIEFDPGLTANILQLANSAYFGWSRTIRSVKDAITRLGTNRILQMVLCMSVAPLVRKPVKGYDLDSTDLWEHSIAVAICAETIARELDLKGVEDGFTAGLLHDIGKIVLGTFVEVDDDPIKEIMELDKLAFNEAEMMVLGIDHAEVAGAMLESWNLPREVVAAARWHHQPHRCDPEHSLLVDLVHVADILCLDMGWGLGTDGMNYRMDEDAAARLGLDVTRAELVMARTTAGVEDMKSLFQSGRGGDRHGVEHSHR